MLRSIATVSLGGTLMEKLTAIAAAGFDGVEIFENDLMYFDGSPAEVRRIAADLGLRILLFQPFRDFEAAPRARMAKNFDRAEAKFDVMEQLGADLMLVCSNTAPDAIDDDSVAAEDLRALGERAARRGFRIGYEALAWGRHVNKFGHAWKLVQAADHPAVGLVVDSFHTFAIEDDDAPIAKIPGDRIFFAQLADAPLMRLDPLVVEPAFPLLPGPGRVPGDALHAQRAGKRLQRTDLAGNLQRRIPRRAAAPDRDRRACARCCCWRRSCARRATARRASARTRRAAAAGLPRLRVHRVRGRCRDAAAPHRRCSTRWALRMSARIAPRT